MEYGLFSFSSGAYRLTPILRYLKLLYDNTENSIYYIIRNYNTSSYNIKVELPMELSRKIEIAESLIKPKMLEIIAAIKKEVKYREKERYEEPEMYSGIYLIFGDFRTDPNGKIAILSHDDGMGRDIYGKHKQKMGKDYTKATVTLLYKKTALTANVYVSDINPDTYNIFSVITGDLLQNVEAMFSIYYKDDFFVTNLLIK